ncbi:MAG: tetratricopeptide repeat protein, partial [Elusimicrobiales bacterium]
MEQAKKDYFFAIALIFFLGAYLFPSSFEDLNLKKKSHKNGENTSISSIDIDTNVIAHIIDNYSFDEDIKDPYKILRNWRLIGKKPEKVADTFVELTSSMSDEEKRKLIEEYQGQISVLLDKLDSKKSVKFQIVLEIVVNSGFIIDPGNFENFKSIADEVIKRYVKEYNNLVRRMPPEKRLPEISTTTLNYDNPLNKLIEFSKKIRLSPHASLSMAENISIKFSTNTSVQNTLSYLFLENSKYEEAEKYASKAIEISPNNFDAYTLRSQARFSLKDIKGAIEDIKKASQIDPSDETARLVATYFEKRKDFDLSKISAIKDSFAESDIIREGSVQSASKSTVLEKQTVFADQGGRVLSDDDKRSAYYLKMAQIKTGMKDYTDALMYINKAIEANPSNLDAYIERANIHNLVGNYSDAVSDATFVLRHDPNNIFALNIRAW